MPRGLPLEAPGPGGRGIGRPRAAPNARAVMVGRPRPRARPRAGSRGSRRGRRAVGGGRPRSGAGSGGLFGAGDGRRGVLGDL